MAEPTRARPSDDQGNDPERTKGYDPQRFIPLVEILADLVKSDSPDSTSLVKAGLLLVVLLLLQVTK